MTEHVCGPCAACRAEDEAAEVKLAEAERERDAAKRLAEEHFRYAEACKSEGRAAEAKLAEAERLHASGRHSIEDTGRGVRICRGLHEKIIGCQWVEYVDAARVEALEKALETLSWHVAAQSSVEGAQPMTNEMAGALARASAVLAAGKP